MKRELIGGMLACVLMTGCDDDFHFFDPDDPDAPRDLTGWYYNLGVDLDWRMGPDWNGEVFRVYGKRANDVEHFLVAEVTSCVDGGCVYRDINVRSNTAYEYYVAALDLDTGAETPSDHAVEVWVPEPIPPPVPESVAAIALDGAVYLHWDDSPALEDDFFAYRVYLVTEEGDFLLGETDSPGFLDLLAENGTTSTYLVTALDDQGHESRDSEVVASTPRVDYNGEVIYVYQDLPAMSGFRFQETETATAIGSGDGADRHLRLEYDKGGPKLVPGPLARIHPEFRATSALKCGPAADADCESWERAPLSGYASAPVPLLPGHSYMLRITGEDGATRFGALRPAIVGADQRGHRLAVFDWAFQHQPDNPSLDIVGD